MPQAKYSTFKGPVARENKRKPLRWESSESARESWQRYWQLGKSSVTLNTLEFFLRTMEKQNQWYKLIWLVMGMTVLDLCPENRTAVIIWTV